MLVLTFGVTEYGRAIYTYNTIAKSVRDAARHLTYALPNENPTNEAINLAVYGNVAGTGAPLAPGLAPGNVNIANVVETVPGSVRLVTVSIQGYVYNSIVTFVAPATLNFNNISVVMRAHL